MRARWTIRAVLICAAALLSCANRTASWVGIQARARADASPIATADRSSCFLLVDLAAGEVRRNPSEACLTRISPASTFKVPHALAALDSGVVADPEETFVYDGRSQGPESWRHDH